MPYLRKSKDRGFVDHGWLRSHHSFSFASYLDRMHMGFSVLRVINDDWIVPDTGFGTHPHDNMEIITYVTSGAVVHKDSMGNITQIKAGEIQVMSAGTGITHSEYNPSATQPLELLQIWIKPNQQDVEPSYAQQLFQPRPGFTLLASVDGRNDSLPIHQNMQLSRLMLAKEESQGYTLAHKSIYTHVISGSLLVNEQMLDAGDALGLTEIESINYSANSEVEALVFDLPQ